MRPLSIAPAGQVFTPADADTLDRIGLTRLHLFAVGVCAFGFSFDLLEIALGNVLAAVYSMPPQRAEPGELAFLLSSAYVGAIVGAPMCGWLADRHGRRLVLAGTMAWLAACSLGAGLAGDIRELSAWRCAGGLALGAFPPLMFAYLTDLLPAARRGGAVLATIALAALGPVAGIFLVRQLGALQPLGLEPWRWGFLAGAAGTLATCLLFTTVPESPRWLALRRRHGAALAALDRLRRSPRVLAPRPPVPAPVVDPGAPRAWPVIALLYFLAPWSTVAFPLLSGAVLAQKGLRLDATLLLVGLSSFGPMIGNLAAAAGIDRLGRRAAMAALLLAMLVSCTVFAAATQPAWLLAASLGFTLFGTLLLSVLNLYCSERFPTDRRARAVAGAWAVNRVGAALAPLLLLPLLRTAGIESMFAVVDASLLAMLVLLAAAAPGPARRSAG